jgi:hypothetical protein
MRNPLLAVGITPESVWPILGGATFYLKNLSRTDRLFCKVRTNVRNLDLITVSPNPCVLDPNQTVYVTVRIAATDEASLRGISTIGLNICSEVLRQGTTPDSITTFSYLSRMRVLLVQSGTAIGKKMLLVADDRPQRRLIPDELNFVHPGSPQANVSSQSQSSSLFSVGNGTALASSVVDETEDGRSEHPRAENGSPGTRAPERFHGKSLVLLTGLICVAIHLFVFSLYSEKFRRGLLSAFENSIFGFVFALTYDPDLPESDLKLDVIGDVFFWVNIVAHLLWIISSGILFTALLFGKKQLTYPWLLMTAFGHLISCLALYEMWGLQIMLPQSCHQQQSFYIWMATLILGSATIYLIWKERKSW